MSANTVHEARRIQEWRYAKNYQELQRRQRNKKVTDEEIMPKLNVLLKAIIFVITKIMKTKRRKTKT